MTSDLGADNPVVASSRATRARLDSLSPAKRMLLAKRLARGAPALDPVAQEEQVLSPQQRRGPLSFVEERFWTAYHLEDRSTAYHVPVTLRLKGELVVPALAGALEAVVARHAVLRTRYPVDPEGEPVAVVDDPRPVPLHVEETAADELRSALDHATAQPFDLETGPLIRARLLKVAADEHYLHLVLHHIVADAWSVAILLRELTTGYNASLQGIRPALPPITCQYRDFARWQRAQAERFARQVEHWQRELGGAPRELGLPTDRPRPRQHRPQVPGRCFAVEFPKAAVLDLAQRTGATLFMVALAAYAVVLGRRAACDDVVVGTPVAGRRHEGDEPLVGCFINTLVMRVDLRGDPSFTELLTRVRDRALRAYDNQDVPFQHVAERVAERVGGRRSLFQVWLALQNVPDAPLVMSGLEVEEPADVVEATKFDITCHLVEGADRLALRVEYDTSLFEERTVRALADEFAAVLAAAAADPDRRLSTIA